MGSQRVGHDWATSLSLSCIGEGNGNPLQCFCLENTRDGGAWWAAVYGVAQSRTQLKRFSSSSSSSVRWLDGITNSMDLSKLQEIVKKREVWCTAAHGVTKSWTRFSNWTTTTSQPGAGSVLTLKSPYVTPVRKAIIQKTSSNKSGRECGGKGTLMHSWWESKLV